jgi:hypothetical protein
VIFSWRRGETGCDRPTQPRMSLRASVCRRTDARKPSERETERVTGRPGEDPTKRPPVPHICLPRGATCNGESDGAGLPGRTAPPGLLAGIVDLPRTGAAGRRALQPGERGKDLPQILGTPYASYEPHLLWAASVGQGRGLRHSPPIHGAKAKSRAQSGEAGRLHEESWRADIDGAAIGRSGIGRTLTLELGESALVASNRPPGATLRPPAGRNIVGVSAVAWSSRYSNRGDRPVSPLAAGPPSSSIRPSCEVVPMIATRSVRLGVTLVKGADLRLRRLSILQSRPRKR